MAHSLEKLCPEKTSLIAGSAAWAGSDIIMINRVKTNAVIAVMAPDRFESR
jgi:hypothetical protein